MEMLGMVEVLKYRQEVTPGNWTAIEYEGNPYYYQSEEQFTADDPAFRTFYKTQWGTTALLFNQLRIWSINRWYTTVSNWSSMVKLIRY